MKQELKYQLILGLQSLPILRHRGVYAQSGNMRRSFTLTKHKGQSGTLKPITWHHDHLPNQAAKVVLEEFPLLAQHGIESSHDFMGTIRPSN